jgi:hypothetical protein
MVKQPRIYVVKKYIKALSALDAIRQEKKYSVDEAVLDDVWKMDFFEGQFGYVEVKEDDDEA